MNAWAGEFGNDYTARNDELPLTPRLDLWHNILRRVDPLESILEVGANVGLNLQVLRAMTRATLYGLEPNEVARQKLKAITNSAFEGTAQSIPFLDDSFDMVFTSGVLIHIPPADLHAAYSEIYRVSKRYIVCIEYFNDTPVEIEYRCQMGLLWKRDFGQMWLDHGVKLVDYGFAWKPATGLDNLTWWIFEK